MTTTTTDRILGGITIAIPASCGVFALWRAVQFRNPDHKIMIGAIGTVLILGAAAGLVRLIRQAKDMRVTVADHILMAVALLVPLAVGQWAVWRAITHTGNGSKSMVSLIGIALIIGFVADLARLVLGSARRWGRLKAYLRLVEAEDRIVLPWQ